MTKDKYGICLSFYAIVAFVLAFMGQVMLCGLLLGFVIISTKDEWLSRQVMQAFFISLLSSVVNYVFGMLGALPLLPLIGGIFEGLMNVISSLISLFILFFVILAIAKVCKGEEANVPLFGKLARKAYGYVAKTVYEEK